MESKKEQYRPDILNCMANLSNDEVFTPPQIANKMLDLLPNEIWSNPNIKFLDPCCKTGVFLREIAKRLIVGLEPIYPDLQERVNHIMKEQLYGIAITDLTALMSRRTLYCSKNSNEQYSVAENMFDDNNGNIFYERLEHNWNSKDENATCTKCGANKSKQDRGEDLETHAYAFIHKDFKEMFNMKFDVIIGNPPYQLQDGGAQSSARPLYHKFIEMAKKLNPKYLVMIVPSRWFSGGKGLDEFRNTMLNDKRIKELVDYPNSYDCFPNVQIEGGVCYFLWDAKYNNDCKITTIKQNQEDTKIRPLLENNMETFIRYHKAVDIFNKVKAHKESSFMDLISTRNPFGFSSTEKGKDNGEVKIYRNGGIGWVDKSSIEKNIDSIDKYKVYISYAYGMGNQATTQVINKPFLGEPNSICSETYLIIGENNNKQYCENIISYMKTKFFRFLVLLIKNSQHGTAKVYKCVPMQDFSKSWTDEELYKKYNLTQEEIEFIDSMIKPME